MIKDKLISGACITVVIFLAPYILTLLLQPGSPTANAVTPTTQSSKYTIVIENNEVNKDISLEEYLVGVVAAEMPASFEKEALKAQAVAARTYALKRLTDVSKLDADSIGQSYLTTDKMRELWGDNYLTYFSKIEAAVNDTKGEVAEYNDELIDAVFHSTSAGKTQGASEVWGKGYDYLAAVESEGDIASPEYLDVRTYTNDEVKNMVKNKVGDFDITTEKIITSLQIISRNDANAMALEGKTYIDIIKHYYTGVEIATVEN
ncbi:MAG: stage sporulation protein [Clostridiales bacterium]|nr:stage sporulation protein [Clostridiales bacterium]